ncbi:hypothetical protein JXQ31_00560 [candidate division KSB1 bacterium]|nr:hypothetical protein [candidate division KSB1 bacterium]
MINVKEMNIRYITDKKGIKKEVILSVKDFENLLEDLQDLAVIAERRDEKTLNHHDVIKKLKQDGIL